VTPLRRTFAFVPSTIVLIVALLASSAALAVSFTGGARDAGDAAQVPAQATITGADARATEPDGLARAALPHAPAATIGRMQTLHASGDGARKITAPSAAQALLDVVALRALGAVVEARQDNARSPGQPAPSSRAPPVG
jgi:hypothetical protein